MALSGSMEVIAAWNDLRAAAGVDAWSLGVGVSLDGGQTWTDSLLRPPGAPLTNHEGDPMTLYDPRTGNLWVGGTTFTQPGNIFIARKAPGATELEPVVLINQNGFFDRGALAVGPAPGSPDSTRLYVAHFQGFQWSEDLGATWSAARSLSFGAAQHPRVGPQGELYVSYWDFTDRILLQRSFDGGVTLSPPILIARRRDFWDTQDGSRFPGLFRAPPLAFLAIDPNDGVLYCVYFDTTEMYGGDANVDIYFTRSADHGDTWTIPAVIHGDADPPGDQFFPWLEVDGRGRLHLLFLDTRHTAQADDVEDGLFDVYYSLSHDGGDSWTEVRLTSTSFGSAAASWPGFEQFLGDYISLAVAGDRVVAVYPATFDGNLDIYAQRIEVVGIFADGFESGDTSAWSSAP